MLAIRFAWICFELSFVIVKFLKMIEGCYGLERRLSVAFA